MILGVFVQHVYFKQNFCGLWMPIYDSGNRTASSSGYGCAYQMGKTILAPEGMDGLCGCIILNILGREKISRLCVCC